MVTLAEHCITDEISLHAVGVLRRKAGYNHLIVPFHVWEKLRDKRTSRPDLEFLIFAMTGAIVPENYTVKLKIWPPELDQPKCT